MTYVGGGGADSGCFLCQKAAERRDRENLVLHRAELGFVLLNLFPYNSGHLMVVPYTHVGELAELPARAGHSLFDLTQLAVRALQAEYHPDAFNIGMNLGKAAGAGLPDHLHVHVVPRWNGDTNFMPLIGETKVLPESLEQTWERLHRRFE
ncbi:MAG: HIT domain-containing protein [Chloroflexi bacterium]|nr:HIT domain-containing protein [Chloroflexota bacterium]